MLRTIISTRGTVAMRYFPSMGHKISDRTYNKSLCKKNSSKKRSTVTLSEEIKPVALENYELKNEKMRILFGIFAISAYQDSNMRKI